MTGPWADARPDDKGSMAVSTAAEETPGEPARVPAFIRPLVESRTYKASLCLVLTLPLGIAGFTWVFYTLAAGLVLSITLLGFPIIAASLVGARRLGQLGRRLARTGFGVTIEEPAPLVRGRGFIGWLWGAFLDKVSWRSELYLVLLLPISFVGGLAVVLLWAGALVFAPLLVITPWVVRGLAALNGSLAATLLGPVTLSEPVRRLQASRRQAVDTAAADLRRIERDLHDGAQARLVALAMDLGMAREKLAAGQGEESTDQAANLVAAAHDEVKQALVELRDLARGIHPAVLTDRGLDAALSAVAARCSVPVTVAVDVPERPSPAIEGIAYFSVCELLVNISKHSQASSAAVTVRRVGDRLYIDVYDDGVGGADITSGSGLAGLRERVESVDGRLVLESDEGGPTIVNVELPCAS
jgi:signal transduction histidine kinase